MLIDPNRAGRDLPRSLPAVRKEPQSAAMRDMVETMDNPPGETRMVVGDDGLLSLDVGGKTMATRENPALAEKATPSFSPQDLMRFGMGLYMAGGYGIGMMPMGFGMSLAFMPMMPLSFSMPMSFPPETSIVGEKPPEPDRPQPRAGSEMAEMVERLGNPQPERQVVVGENGLLTMMDDPYRPS